MKLWVLGVVIVALLAMRLLKPRMWAWAAAWWLACLAVLLWGFVVPVPDSVIWLFMAIVTGSLLAYVTSDPQRLAEVRDPVLAFLTERRYHWVLIAVALLIPAAAAYSIYRQMTSPPVAPGFGRTVHPAPPDSITVHETEYDLGTLVNPYRHLEQTDPAAFERHLERGREIYFSNCFYCHGDAMRGAGDFAHGLTPIPTNFEDPGTIANLRSSYLFWRVAKGAPGLPEEGSPWESGMPAWDQFMSEEEMWDVILFLYEFTGQEPRAAEGEAE